MKLTSQRHLFDIPEDVAYLNCAYMSPLMHRVREAAVTGLTRKCQPWKISSKDFFTGSDALRAAFAELIRAEAGDIAIVPAASYGISTAAKNLPLAAGESVLLVEDQFPSNVYPWRERTREVGANLVTVARPQDGDWTEAVLAALDRHIRIVALPHCLWTDGGLFDLERISEVCRRNGAALCLDVTQSLGALPLDVRRIQPDFLVAATYKWLMGPYSLGLLYVSERWQQEGRPIEHNWIQRKDSENFARLVDYQDEFAPGAQRFDVGERSNFALVPAAEAGIRQILDWGVSNVAETLGATTEGMAARALELGLSSAPRKLCAPHYLGLGLGPDVSSDILARLAERKVYVSVRGPSMRVTPHLYNDASDVDRFFAALEAVLG